MCSTSSEGNFTYIPHFSTLCYSEPSVQTLSRIYSAFISNYFTSNRFHSDILEMVPQLVSALIYVYKKIHSTLLPTPQSPQLLFTTHDLSKVHILTDELLSHHYSIQLYVSLQAFSGLIRIHPRDFPSKDCIIHLMSHELFRVFSDRCLTPERDVFVEILSDSIRIYFQVRKMCQCMKTDIIWSYASSPLPSKHTHMHRNQYCPIISKMNSYCMKNSRNQARNTHQSAS